MKLHPGPEWHIFHILTIEDINQMSLHPLSWLFVQKVGEKWQANRFVYVRKRKLHGGLKI